MRITKITKEQWLSVIKNTLLAAIAAAVPLALQGDYDVAVSAAVMAALKVVEKAFTPA